MKFTEPPLTCADLSEQKRWTTELCCTECHADESLLIQEVLAEKNPLKGRRRALICCRAVALISDWYAGKHYDFLPEHE